MGGDLRPVPPRLPDDDIRAELRKLREKLEALEKTEKDRDRHLRDFWNQKIDEVREWWRLAQEGATRHLDERVKTAFPEAHEILTELRAARDERVRRASREEAIEAHERKEEQRIRDQREGRLKLLAALCAVLGLLGTLAGIAFGSHR